MEIAMKLKCNFAALVCALIVNWPAPKPAVAGALPGGVAVITRTVETVWENSAGMKTDFSIMMSWVESEVEMLIIVRVLEPALTVNRL